MRVSRGYAVLFVPLLICATSRNHPREPKTEAAVLAASDDWIASERVGHVADVDARLMADYLDVESTGKSHTKAELLAHTANRKDIWPGTKEEVAAAFHKKYPTINKVVIEGNTAILSYYPSDHSRPPYIIAEDIFAYKGGMWKGILSNHFSIPKDTAS